MPWKLVRNHPACRSGEWAVVNQRAEAEGRRSIEGCHATRERALAQQRALYANEPQAHEVETMERKQLATQIKDMTVSDDGPGEVTGLASVYGNIDLQDDVVEAGAAVKTARDWTASTKAKPPLLDWHGDSISRIIGSVPEMKSTAAGVWFRGAFANTPEAQRARQLAKDGHLTGVSIGYTPIRQSMKMIGDKLVRVLHEIRIHEISLTPIPANPEAQLASVKSVGQATATFDYVSLDAGLRAAMAISFEPARKAAVLELLTAYQTGLQQAAGPADGSPTADGAAPTDDVSAEGTPTPPPTDDAAAYALRLITPPGPRDGAPDGKPPTGALAYPQQLLESARQQADIDRLEAEINHALGRAAG
jgi:HK97 family phage prohead protease